MKESASFKDNDSFKASRKLIAESAVWHSYSELYNFVLYKSQSLFYMK